MSNQTIYLKDYQAPGYVLNSVELTIEIFSEYTLVSSNIKICKSPNQKKLPLVLHGVDLELVSIAIDGTALNETEYFWQDEECQIAKVPDDFTLSVVNRIHPASNTSLEGLYLSGGMYSTQCEAQGFRKITLFPDRPDVMTTFITRIEADKSEFPTLLGNGNLLETGDLSDGRHFATWQDPFAKPCYLFAMVAGNLEHIHDTFTTQSGREIDLKIYTETHNIHKTEFAMQALKRSMKWDEERFGREYDLVLFMIVAVDFFNMGAMENKGLNIFNSAVVLADPKTTTDDGFERIEAVIGHEYFHNWSGNRVTCRDWFQLSLKEGFTVFRDAEFTSDLHNRDIKRIDDVRLMRTAQFNEDAGPMSHPIRPASYVEINNFYTLTVYEKGAEVVRMIHTLLGEKTFRKGSDLYFDRFDGQAVTTEDFVACMEEVSSQDLTQFKRWYDQAGTPEVKAVETFEKGVYTLTLSQSCKQGNQKEPKLDYHLPIKMALLSENGDELVIDDEHYESATQVYHLKSASQTISISGLSQKPVASLLRDFSAPIKLFMDRPATELAFLVDKDPNYFIRWDALQTLLSEALLAGVRQAQAGEQIAVDDMIVGLLENIINNQSLDHATKAMMLSLPSYEYIAQQMQQIDVTAIMASLDAYRLAIKTQFAKPLQSIYQSLQTDEAFEFEKGQVGKRHLSNVALAYLSFNDGATSLAIEQFHKNQNMTNCSAALTVISQYADKSVKKAAFDAFYKQWSSDTQVVEQWLGLQARGRNTDLTDIDNLMKHPAFDINNPNKVRAVIGAFCAGNPSQFHQQDGTGYQFLAKQIKTLNEINPQIASRLCMPLTQFKKYDQHRQDAMKQALNDILAIENLSKDVFEVVDRSINF